MKKRPYNTCPDDGGRLYAVFVYRRAGNRTRTDYKYCHECNQMFQIIVKPSGAKKISVDSWPRDAGRPARSTP